MGGASYFASCHAPQLVRRARGCGDQRARAGDPADVRHQRRHDGLHQHRVSRVLRARRGARWLADHVRRVPIVGVSSLLFGFFHLSPASTLNAFVVALLWTRFFTGMRGKTRSPCTVVDGEQAADAGTHRGCRRSDNMVGHGLGLATRCSAAVARPRGLALWAWIILRHPRGSSASPGSLRKPPRRPFEQDVLGEQIADDKFRSRSQWSPVEADPHTAGRCSSDSARWASDCSRASLYLDNTLHVSSGPGGASSSA